MCEIKIMNLNPNSSDYEPGWLVVPVLPYKLDLASYSEGKWSEVAKKNNFVELKSQSGLGYAHEVNRHRLDVSNVQYMQSLFELTYYRKPKKFLKKPSDPFKLKLLAPCDGILAWNRSFLSGELSDFNSTSQDTITGIFLKSRKGQRLPDTYRSMYQDMFGQISRDFDVIWERAGPYIPNDWPKSFWIEYLKNILITPPIVWSDSRFNSEYGI